MPFYPDFGRAIAQNLNRNVALEHGDRGYFIFVNEPLAHICTSLSEAKEIAERHIGDANTLQIEIHVDDIARQGYLFDNDSREWVEVQPNNSFKPKPLRGSA